MRRMLVLLLAGVIAALAASPAGAYLYWASNSSRAIGRADQEAKVVEPSFIALGIGPIGVAVDAGHVYWGDYGNHRIGRANLDGTGVELSFITGATFPEGVAADGAHVYWANIGAGSIGRANLDGSGVQQSFITGASGPQALAVDAGHLYWDNNTGWSIGRASLDGSAVVQGFIGGASYPQGIAVDGGHVYWANPPDSTIGRANIDGTGVQQDWIPTGGTDTLGVAVDASHVYWANHDRGEIWRAKLDGTGAERLIAGLNGPYGLVTDANGPPHAEQPPAISGTPQVGQTLTCDRGTWIGTATLSFTYAWTRDGSAILGTGTAVPGATASTYTPVEADAGHTLTCTVGVANGLGSERMDTAAVTIAAAATGGGSTPTPAPTPTPTVVRCAVPDLWLLRLATARTRLAAAHCKAGKIVRVASLFPKGWVLAQSPPAARSFASGKAVKVFVSNGPNRRKAHPKRG